MAFDRKNELRFSAALQERGIVRNFGWRDGSWWLDFGDDGSKLIRVNLAIQGNLGRPMSARDQACAQFALRYFDDGEDLDQAA